MVHDIKDTGFWGKIPFLRPYALLARWDRPIGFWLLYWPCVWSMVLAPSFAALSFEQKTFTLVLFFVGAITMRGAGCTLNDLYDRKLDAQVARTRQRPLACGMIKPWQAIVFFILQLVIGAVILLQLPFMAIALGLLMLPLIATYPLMKRFVWGPQFFLALNFASGALIGWAAMENNLGWIPVILYAAGICWVVAYDTVYAHMDLTDDSLIGIKSTALHWGPDSKYVIGWLWLVSLVLFGVALFLAGATWVSYVMLALATLIQFTAHFLWNPENDAYSLRYFRLQHQIGLVLALAALAPLAF